MSSLETSALKTFLEETYQRFHKEEFIDPDPLSRVRMYPGLADREVAAFICSSLALGRVGGILHACDEVLTPFGAKLKDHLLEASKDDLDHWFEHFRYRFFSRKEIVSFLYALKGVLREYGTLEECFFSGYRGSGDNPEPGIEKIFHGMIAHRNDSWGILLSDPSKSGGMKRWYLFLRWMVRKDRIDPGGWRSLLPAVLRVPVDTHLYRWGLRLRLTHRKGIDRTTVEEITHAFRMVDPEDPVRFDFSLSRLGIHPKLR